MPSTAAPEDYEYHSDVGGKDYYYNYGAATLSPEVLAKQTEFGVVFAVSFVAIILQFYVSVFGRRMLLHPLRWHTMNVAVWNMYQLFLFADQSSNTPWKDFLRNPTLADNKVHMEMMTLTIFPASMVFILPAALIAHFKPSVSRSVAYKWAVWLVLILFLDILTVVAYFSYRWWAVLKNGELKTWAVPVEAYQVAVITIFFFTLLYFAIGTLIAILHYVCVRATGRTKKAHSDIGSRTVDLVLLLVYSYVTGMMHFPANAENMIPFMLEKVAPLLRNPNGGLSGGMPNLGLIIAFLGLKEDSELFIPLTELLLTFVCIRMYREQYLHVLSCGRFYREPNGGDVWRLCGSKSSKDNRLHDVKWGQPAPSLVKPAVVEVNENMLRTS